LETALIIIIIVRLAPCQCIALLAADKVHWLEAKLVNLHQVHSSACCW